MEVGCKRLRIQKEWCKRMVVKFKNYEMLDGTEKTLLVKVGMGTVIRRFDKTPFPHRPTDVICPHFMELAWAWGCPYNCAYCYLKGTYRFFIKNDLGRVPIGFKKTDQIRKEVEEFLRLDDIPAEILNAGELCDGLMAEAKKEWPWGHEPFSSWIMKYFNGTRHKILFLTKGTNVDNFLKNNWQNNVILAWSLNADAVSKRWEHSAPPLEQRLEAAREAYLSGYSVRVRIDPMVPVENWKDEYTRLVDEIFKAFEPERVTLGSLRGLISTITHAKDKSWVKYLEETSSWGRKPSFRKRYAMYIFLMGYIIDKYRFSEIGICKETLEMWQSVEQSFNQYGIKYQKIKCNCVP